MADAFLLLLFIPLTKFARAHAHNRYICLNRFSTFKGALNHTTIKLYSMANIERAIKAVIAKRGLEFSLKDETMYHGGTRPFGLEWIDIANTEYRYTAIRIPVNTGIFNVFF
jgi:hypothetical protein